MNTEGKEEVIYDGIKFTCQSSGYYRSTRIFNNHRLFLHRFIYEKYYGKIQDGHEPHHIDFNKNNNNIENLRIMTYSEHRSLHNKTPEFLAKRISINKDPMFIAKCIETKRRNKQIRLIESRYNTNIFTV